MDRNCFICKSNTSSVAEKQLAYIISQFPKTTSWLHPDFPTCRSKPRFSLNSHTLIHLHVCCPHFNMSAIELAQSRLHQILSVGVEIQSHSSRWAASFHFDALPRRHFSHWYSDGWRTERDTITQHGMTKTILAHKSCATLLSYSASLILQRFCVFWVF